MKLKETNTGILMILWANIESIKQEQDEFLMFSIEGDKYICDVESGRYQKNDETVTLTDIVAAQDKIGVELWSCGVTICVGQKPKVNNA